MDTKIKLLVAATLVVTATSTYALTICVFDPLGSQGDNFSLMKDYAVAAKQWEAEITLKPYSDEKLATVDFKSGKCDGMAITSIRARALNDFAATVSAPVAVMTNEQAKTILTLVGNPKLASDMRSGDVEVAGVTNLGFTYLIVRDRSVNTLAKLTTVKFGALSYDQVQKEVIERFGGTSIPLELSDVGSAFNSGKVGAVLVPAVAFKPLELNKGVGPKVQYLDTLLL